jgi:hypothetical protein
VTVAQLSRQLAKNAGLVPASHRGRTLTGSGRASAGRPPIARQERTESDERSAGARKPALGVRTLQGAFTAAYSATSVLFLATGVALITFAAASLIAAVPADQEARARLDQVLEAIALLTIAVAALELGQTILEEEVLRRAHMSAPTRVRRFLSRFMVVIVVALSIEALVGVFQLLHRDPSRLPHAASVGAAAALLLVAWGLFVRLNRAAEELEPEAMAEAKGEDRNLG